MREISDPHIISAIVLITIATVVALIAWVLGLEMPKPPKDGDDDGTPIPLFPPF